MLNFVSVRTIKRIIITHHTSNLDKTRKYASQNGLTGGTNANSCKFLPSVASFFANADFSPKLFCPRFDFFFKRYRVYIHAIKTVNLTTTSTLTGTPLGSPPYRRSSFAYRLTRYSVMFPGSHQCCRCAACA
jgi:hypothetical protein